MGVLHFPEEFATRRLKKRSERVGSEAATGKVIERGVDARWCHLKNVSRGIGIADHAIEIAVIGQSQRIKGIAAVYRGIEAVQSTKVILGQVDLENGSAVAISAQVCYAKKNSAGTPGNGFPLLALYTTHLPTS